MVGKILNNVQNKVVPVKTQDILSLISGLFAVIGGILIVYSLTQDGSVLFSMAGQVSVAFAMLVFGLMHHIRGEDDLFHAETAGALAIAALSTPPIIPSGLLENFIIALGLIMMAGSVGYIYYFYVWPEIKKQIGIK